MNLSDLAKRPRTAGAIAGWYQQAASMGGALASIPMLVDDLGRINAGIWFTFLSVAVLVQNCDFGFSASLARQVAYTYTKRPGKNSFSRELINVAPGHSGITRVIAIYNNLKLICDFIAVTLSVVLCALILLGAFTIASSTNVEEALLLSILVAACSSVSIRTRFNQSILDGTGHLYINRIVAGTYQLAFHLMSVMVAAFTQSLILLAVNMFLLQSVQLFILKKYIEGRYAPTNRHHGMRRYRTNRVLIAKIIAISAPLGMINLGAAITSTAQIPTISHSLGPEVATEIYAFMKITQALSWTIIQVISTQIPTFIHRYSSGDFEAAKRLFHRTCCNGALAYILAGGAVYIFGERLLSFLTSGVIQIERMTLDLMIFNFSLAGILAIPTSFVLASGRRAFYYSTPIHGAISLIGIIFLSEPIGTISIPFSFLLGLLATNLWVNIKEALRLNRRISIERSL